MSPHQAQAFGRESGQQSHSQIPIRISQLPARAVCPNIRTVSTGYSRNSRALTTVPQRTAVPRLSAPLMRQTIFWAKKPWAMKQNSPHRPRY